MHRLVLDVNENVLDKIIYFLNHLPQKDVKIVQDETIETEQLSNDGINFSDYKVDSFKAITDPIAWQKALRSEWDR